MTMGRNTILSIINAISSTSPSKYLPYAKATWVGTRVPILYELYLCPGPVI